MRVYRAYLFDLYGTMVDIHTDESRPALWREMSAWYKSHGADYTPAELRRTYLELCRQREERLRQTGKSAWPEIELSGVFAELYARRGVTADDALTAKTARVFRRASTTHLRLYSGAVDLLDQLRQKGGQVFLLSNAQRIFTMPELEELGVLAAFDDVFISSDYGCKKPDPNFFRAPLERHGLAAGDCLMIGNDPICDVGGAAAIGMDSVFIRSALSPREIPDHVPAVLRLEGVDLRRLRRLLI